MSFAQSTLWQEAMEAELLSITTLQVFDSLPLPPYTRAIPVKWIYKIKTGICGEVTWKKARLVVCGFMQKNCVDVDETYTPISKYASLRFLVSHCCAEKIEITHLNIRTAILNAPLDEEVWCDPPPGVSVPPGHKWGLKRALFGLKQAPRAWNLVLKKNLLRLGFTPSTSDPCLYILITSSGERIFMNTYVDDLFLAANPSTAKDDIISGLSSSFAITNLGVMSNPLSIEVITNPITGSVLLCQSRLALSLLEEVNQPLANDRLLPLDPNIKLTKTPLDEVHTVVPESAFPYMKVAGTLLYLVNCTRPDLAHAVGLLCRFNHAPRPTHVAAAKSVLRYLCGTKHKGVSHTTTSTPLQGYCDYDGDVDGRKSTTGWIWTENGGPISWQSMLQSVAAQSTCEAEYYGAGSATKEALWRRKYLSDFGLPVSTLPIFTGNQASLSPLKHGAFSPATKHIAVIYHVVRESVLRRDVIFASPHIYSSSFIHSPPH
jgi:hypothetical protein